MNTHMKKARTKTYVPVIFEDCCSYVITVSGAGGADADAPMKMKGGRSDEQPSGEGSGRPMGAARSRCFFTLFFISGGIQH